MQRGSVNVCKDTPSPSDCKITYFGFKILAASDHTCRYIASDPLTLPALFALLVLHLLQAVTILS